MTTIHKIIKDNQLITITLKNGFVYSQTVKNLEDEKTLV